ncbi:hypothetical protein ON010_g4183 [Phytophthora cinnamomi]|nr:hypothetical protein ON010_g4183 [Phytophthora cinnamomi]
MNRCRTNLVAALCCGAAAVSGAFSPLPDSPLQSVDGSALFVLQDSMDSSLAWAEYERFLLSRSRATPLLLYFAPDPTCFNDEGEEDEGEDDQVQTATKPLTPAQQACVRHGELLESAMERAAETLSRPQPPVVRVDVRAWPKMLHYHLVSTTPSLLWMPGRSSGRFQRYPHVETNFLELSINGSLFAGKLSDIDFSEGREGLQQSGMAKDAVAAEVTAFVRLCQERSGYLVRNARGGLSPAVPVSHSPGEDAFSVLELIPIFGFLAFIAFVINENPSLVLLRSGAWLRVRLSELAAAIRAGGAGEWHLELLAVPGSDEYFGRGADAALAPRAGGSHSLVAAARGRLVHGVVYDVPDEVQVVGLESPMNSNTRSSVVAGCCECQRDALCVRGAASLAHEEGACKHDDEVDHEGHHRKQHRAEGGRDALALRREQHHDREQQRNHRYDVQARRELVKVPCVALPAAKEDPPRDSEHERDAHVDTHVAGHLAYRYVEAFLLSRSIVDPHGARHRAEEEARVEGVERHGPDGVDGDESGSVLEVTPREGDPDHDHADAAGAAHEAEAGHEARVVVEEGRGQQEHEEWARDPILSRREQQQTPVAEHGADHFPADVGERRVHHGQQPRAHQQVHAPHGRGFDEGVHGRELAEADARARREQNPQRQEAVEH